MAGTDRHCPCAAQKNKLQTGHESGWLEDFKWKAETPAVSRPDPASPQVPDQPVLIAAPAIRNRSAPPIQGSMTNMNVLSLRGR
jgi:hypothetical protein